MLNFSTSSVSTASTSSSGLVWRPDGTSNTCCCCDSSFSIWRRRHHCRACGELVCGTCSPYTDSLPDLGYDMPVRVCTKCNINSTTSTLVTSDGEFSDIEDEIVEAALNILTEYSKKKQSKLNYQYFVQSEAVSWLIDAAILSNRSRCAALFNHLVDEGYITVKSWSGRKGGTFYIVQDVSLLETGTRDSKYECSLHSETKKCNNCSKRFLESLTSSPGFCSIDCKTTAYLSEVDAAYVRRYYN